MNTLRKSFARSRTIHALHSDDRGLSTVEYVIILVLIAAGAIGTWQSFGTTLTGKIKASNTEMDKISVQGNNTGNQ